MSSRKKTIATNILLEALTKTLPGLRFVEDSQFLWSPQNQTIHYPSDALNQPEGQARLVHEFGHAILGHTTYGSDFGLLRMELDAWEQAKQTASQLGLILDQEFIEDCLDTYRDWVHRRSTCPRCTTVSFQQTVDSYRCHNCQKSWRVTSERFRRAYRIQKQYA